MAGPHRSPKERALREPEKRNARNPKRKGCLLEERGYLSSAFLILYHFNPHATTCNGVKLSEFRRIIASLFNRSRIKYAHTLGCLLEYDAAVNLFHHFSAAHIVNVSSPNVNNRSSLLEQWFGT